MLKKVLSIAGLLLVLTVGVAQAQPYPPAGNSISVGGDLYPGGSVTITAQTFQAGAVVEFTVNSKPAISGTAVAGADGVASFTATLPNDTRTGNHVAKAKGTGADGRNLTLTQNFDVESGPASVLGQQISNADRVAGGSDGFPGGAVLAASAAVAGGLLLLLRRRLSAASPAPEAPASDSVSV